MKKNKMPRREPRIHLYVQGREIEQIKEISKKSKITLTEMIKNWIGKNKPNEKKENTIISENNSLQNLLTMSREEIEKTLETCIEIIDEDDLHVTLIETKMIGQHNIQRFIKELKEELSNKKSFLIYFKNQLDLFKNIKGNKYFFGISVTSNSHNMLRTFIDPILEIFKKYGLEEYLKKRLFHITVTKTNLQLDNLLTDLNFNLENLYWEDITKNNPYINQENAESNTVCWLIDHVAIRMGSKYFTICLTK